MNLLLLHPDEIDASGVSLVRGRRARHAQEVLRVVPGQRLRAGLLGGDLGWAEVLACGSDVLRVRVTLGEAPPPRSPVALVLALPRPKILRRVLQAVASAGVARLALVGSYRVEKSYFASPLLAADALREELVLGLEQGRDTVLPEVELHRHWKPFVEDRLNALAGQAGRLLADPAGAPLTWGEPRDAGVAPGRAVLAVGPEGGFTSYETRTLLDRGFTPFTLGPRTLRVDVAVPFALGQVELALASRLTAG